jgi:phage shock protein C
MVVYCSSCGSALPPGARFCSSCGAVIASAPPAGYAPYGFPPPPRLVRPIHGRQFAGVCIGMARTYGWDVGLVRILAVVLGVLVFPFTELIYVACWIGIPEETLADNMAPPVPPPVPQL